MEESWRWMEQHFHPEGLRGPRCQASVAEARRFPHTRRSQRPVYRCQRCGQTYDLYTGTVLEGHHRTPQQGVLRLRGMAEGESTQVLAAELGLSYGTVLTLRHEIQAQAVRRPPETPLPDEKVEADERFQNAGEKAHRIGISTTHPAAGNRRRRHGTYENDRPPILGVVGRTGGPGRRRMAQWTDQRDAAAFWASLYPSRCPGLH